MKRIVKVLGTITLVFLLGAGAFYTYRADKGVSSTTTSVAPLATSTPVTQAVGQNERLYTNAAFHFSLQYPNNLQATDYKEQNGALTASFQDPSTSQGFEVYVTPYSGTQIDQSRFKLDEPSGTFLQPTNVVIAGTQATMFYGNNEVMGDTREVWFIKNGFLYEVTTYKALDAWLAQIMTSWKFI